MSLLVPCAHRKLNVKHYRTTPIPEAHITRQIVEEAALCGDKIENRAAAPKKRIQAAQQPLPPATRQQHNFWVELVRVCRLAVVAAAAACCSYSDKENAPPPNEARAIRREGRRAISAWQGGTYPGTACRHHQSFASFGRVDGAFL